MAAVGATPTCSFKDAGNSVVPAADSAGCWHRSSWRAAPALPSAAEHCCCPWVVATYYFRSKGRNFAKPSLEARWIGEDSATIIIGSQESHHEDNSSVVNSLGLEAANLATTEARSAAVADESTSQVVTAAVPLDSYTSVLLPGGGNSYDFAQAFQRQVEESLA